MRKSSSFRRFIEASALSIVAASLSSACFGQSATKTMTEYVVTSFNYYFLTSRDNEKALLDANPAFKRTGNSFTVLAEPVGGAVGIRRFYFDQIAKNGARGSHFYTLIASEVAALNGLNPTNAALPRLPVNEGIDSYAYPAAADNVAEKCDLDKEKIYRVFRGNARFPDDANHRFTNNRALYLQLIAEGWDDEGVKFCGVGGAVVTPPISGAAVRTYRGTFRGGQQNIEFNGNVTWSLVAGERGPAGELIYRVSAATANIPGTFPDCSAPGAVSIDTPSSDLAVSEASTAGGSVRYGGVFTSIPVIITCGNPPAQAPFGYLWFTCQTDNNNFSNQNSPSAARLQGSCNANDGASFAWDFQAIE